MLKSLLKSSVISVGLASSLLASQVTIQNGWNLVGTGTDTVNLANTFSSHTNVSIVWGYDNISKNWVAYGNDTTTQNLITNSSFTPITSVTANSGYWVYNSGSSFNVDLVANTPATKQSLTGDITSDMTLTADKVWRLEGLVAVKNGATLTIEPGTTIIGKAGTGANTSYLVIDKGSKIMAQGTASQPITFTSETAYDGGAAAVGQWGGVTIIGNAGNSQVGAYEVNEAFVPGTSDMADNSGVLTYIRLLNSGITMEPNKEVNGLSFVGVGSGTTVDHIYVNKSDDDCIETWGGSVNMSNIDVSECTDDHFDIDDGYSGKVTNLHIYGSKETIGYSGIEMSGTTAATFENLFIDMEDSYGEGAIHFKKGGIGGHFINATIIYNAVESPDGALYMHGSGATYDAANTTFNNVVIAGQNPVVASGDTDAVTSIKSKLSQQQPLASLTKQSLTGDITSDMTLTADKVWRLEGLVAVKNGATLTIEPGTTIIGKAGTGANTSYLVIDKGSKIMAEGTDTQPITFTSETAYDGGAAAVGQWGGVTLIGNAGNSQVGAYEVNEAFTPGMGNLTDNSGIIKNVRLLNSGITMEPNKEINGLSMVAVGSGTTVENLIVQKSDDDCVETWGGTVNYKNIFASECTDDHFDIDDGYSGTVTNLSIYGSKETIGYSGIEMSGTTAATFENLFIDMEDSYGEGAIHFKKGGVGGHFKNAQIIYNASESPDAPLYLHTSGGTFDSTNTSFENVAITGSATSPIVSGDNTTQEAQLLSIFNAQ